MSKFQTCHNAALIVTDVFYQNKKQILNILIPISTYTPQILVYSIKALHVVSAGMGLSLTITQKMDCRITENLSYEAQAEKFPDKFYSCSISYHSRSTSVTLWLWAERFSDRQPNETYNDL